MIGLRLEIGYGGAQPQGYNPATQFAAGGLGLWYDTSDYATQSQDSAGATPVTAVGQTVGRMLDKSGRGNTYSQATAAARSLTSARVNLLIKSEQFNDVIWTNSGTLLGGATTDPFGGNNATLVTGPTSGNQIYQSFSPPNPPPLAVSVFYVRRISGVGVVSLKNPDGVGETVMALTTAWQRFTSTATALNGGTTAFPGIIFGAGTANDQIAIFGAQLGTVATRYQRVNTATDYDEVGFPRYLTYDGVDDSGVTGAATFSSNMDCFVALRRNSSVLSVLCAGSVPASAYMFAHETAGAGTISAGVGASTTYAVSGVDVPGGTAATRAQLATAWPVSQFVVLEARNLDLTSANWGAIGLSNFGAGNFIGMDFVQMILAPAGDATARQKNRQYAGNKAGLTL